MKKFFSLFGLLLLFFAVHAQFQPFRFAFISDTHIGSPSGAAEEDLRRTVRDINQHNDIAFVVITGDITELGTNQELQLARHILDSLRIKWYIIPGNHDTGWSESGGDMFTTVFGYAQFSFEYNDIRFLGCPSGPYVRMSDGHVPRSSLNWLDAQLKTIPRDQPLIFLNHYPIDDGLDNWYEITNRLHKYNTQAILCGHGHANHALNFEDIPGVMGRSNLRAKAAVGGYNIVDVRADSLVFTEQNPVTGATKTWTSVLLGKRNFAKHKSFKRPDYRINDTFSFIKERWRFASDANVISTPAVDKEHVIFGNQSGMVTCLSLDKGKVQWKTPTGGAIFSSPAISGRSVVLGAADGGIYCFDTRTGALRWKTMTSASVLGSPLIAGDTVFIGGSGHAIYALSLATGKYYWTYSGLEGPVVSTPLLYDSKLIVGAWDRHLYALDQHTGELQWKWNNGSSVRNFSPAACIPVAKDGVIYIVAPDRYITAIDSRSGATLWRNNDATIRESIGISADGTMVYGKTMQDTIVAYHTSRTKQSAAWKLAAGFGYEHVPSMLIEKDGMVYFGTKSGVVYCIDPLAQKKTWAHKIDNSMVNTVQVLARDRLVVSTMDGKVVLLGR